jgi:predicted peroxiredoxin
MPGRDDGGQRSTKKFYDGGTQTTPRRVMGSKRPFRGPVAADARSKSRTTGDINRNEPSREAIMSEEKRKLVIVVTRGFDDERSSVAWSVANSGINSGLEVTMFLVSSGVDWVRKGAAEVAQPNPLDPPVGEMIDNFLASGGHILICPPCARVRGYTDKDLFDGVSVVGSTAMHALIAQGAATLSF